MSTIKHESVNNKSDSCKSSTGERNFNSAVGYIINAVVHYNLRYSKAIAPVICHNLMNSLFCSYADKYKTMDELKAAILEEFGLTFLPKGLREIVCREN